VLENGTDFKQYRVRVSSSGFRDSERKVRTLKMMPVGGAPSAQNTETAADVRELVASD
jgi:hypothetical protein